MFENLVSDALSHLVAGVTLSIVDFSTSKISNQSVERIEIKKDCLIAMDFILEQNNTGNGASTDIKETNYAENIIKIRKYLISNGLLKNRVNFVTYLNNFIKHEKINNLTVAQKFGLAIGLEVIYDTLFGFHHYTVIMKQSPIAAIASNIYQIPAFFAGLLFGEKILGIYKWLAISSDEKSLDKTIDELIKNTPVIKYVQEFTPSPDTSAKMNKQGIDNIEAELTYAGKKIFTGLQGLADRTKKAMECLVNYKMKNEEKLKNDSEARKKRFDEITKGR